MFQVTTLDFPKAARPGKPLDYSKDFFKRKAFLTVSGQLQAEIFAHSFVNVYTFGPTFRAEHSTTPRHLAEFYMIEPEMAFCDLNDNQDLAEEFLKALAKKVLTACEPDLKIINEQLIKFDKNKRDKQEEPYDGKLIEHIESLIATDFERVTYTEAIALLQKADRAWEYPPQWGENLQTEHERHLTEKVFKKPVIVTNYPRGKKAFYMRINDDGKTVAAMDVLVPRIGEIIGGSQREERYDVLLSRLKEQDQAPQEVEKETFKAEKDYWSYIEEIIGGNHTETPRDELVKRIRELDARRAPYEKTETHSAEKEHQWYLDLRRFGGVAHSGFGMGFERMMMYLTGMQNIQDVIPFPRAYRKALF
jgi:asparaginyl-tRNA synthetase